jgi:non-haem Fe2+, alpha-ketoglutarate-dependent halogenase
VKASTRIYPGMTTVSDHGHSYDLKNYAAVLVSGDDKYGHNRLTRTNLNGHPFKWL